MFVPYQEYKYSSPYKEPMMSKKPYHQKIEVPSPYQREVEIDIPQLGNSYGYPRKGYERMKILLPIPKGSTAYAQAKRAEYVEKNLAKAEQYYRMAIDNNERLESAIKDLATVLHQQGKTEEACRFLEEHKHLCTKNQIKFENLLTNLKKQIVPSGNYVNRTLVLFNLPGNFDESKVKAIFGNSSRITQIEFLQDYLIDQILDNYLGSDKPDICFRRCALLHFSSNSAARKTLETLKDNNQTFYWMNLEGLLTSRAEVLKKQKEPRGKKNLRKESESTSFSQNMESMHFMESDSDSSCSSRRESVSAKEQCWESLVFPSLPKDDTPGSSRKSSFFEEFIFDDGAESYKVYKNRQHTVWNQMKSRLSETRSMISGDPDFVKKLLKKVIDDFDTSSKNEVPHRLREDGDPRSFCCEKL